MPRKRLVNFAAAAAAAVTFSTMFTLPAARADETELFRIAADQHWTADDWAAFTRWVDWLRFVTICDAANTGDRGAIDALIGLIFPPDVYATFQRIIARESNYQPWAKNRSSTASGLTQQLSTHAWRYTRRGWSWDTDRFDACKNLSIARELYDESGTSAWSLTR